MKVYSYQSNFSYQQIFITNFAFLKKLLLQIKDTGNTVSTLEHGIDSNHDFYRVTSLFSKLY